jgi:rare lipoprotein A
MKSKWAILLAFSFCLLSATACAPKFGTIDRPTGWSEKGDASWYGEKFHGRRTASGEIYDMYKLTAAHRTLPFGTLVKVTHRRTGRSVVVRINDRGPSIRSRIIDLSYASAKQLGIIREGVAPVVIEVVSGG